MITYRDGSLFSAPPGSYLAHACNCKGRWGSGIAKEFASRYPKQYAVYNSICMTNGDSLRGRAAIIPATGAQIVCLFTSRGYGQHVDSPEMILEATDAALAELETQVDAGTTIHMPKINSSLFKTPWEDTEAVLKRHGGLNYEVWVI